MTSRLPFFKYHGLGNDFVLFDGRVSPVSPRPEEVRKICDRRRGIGADGILRILAPRAGEACARMQVHNADGSVAETCGNGLRCVVRFLFDHQPDLFEKGSALIETDAGLVEARVDGEVIEVQMGQASIAPVAVGAQGPLRELDSLCDVGLKLGDREVVVTGVSMGNPHLVLFDTPLEDAATLGPILEGHPFFPKGVNAGFVHLAADGGLDLRVWERGAGLTQACGSGACAAVVAAIATRRRRADHWLEVRLPGGTLQVWASAQLDQIRMRGPAVMVYEGTLRWPLGGTGA